MPRETARETPFELLKTLRALREDMRLSLMEVPEYRALAALDRSIEEISAIMQTPQDPEPVLAPRSPEPEPAIEAPRGNSVAAAFADSLASRLERRPARIFSTPQALRG